MSNYKNTSPAKEVRAIKRLLKFLKKKSEYLQTTLSTSPPCPPKPKLSIGLLYTTSIPPEPQPKRKLKIVQTTDVPPQPNLIIVMQRGPLFHPSPNQLCLFKCR